LNGDGLVPGLVPGLVSGRLIGIARRAARRVPMELVDGAAAVVGGGVEGDHKGVRFPKRGVTILAREDWEAAIAGLADLAGPVPLPWTARRANLLVEGLVLPRAAGAILTVGPVRLEVTAQTYPCRRMDEVHQGLLKALALEWRGGVTCRVLEGGRMAIGCAITVVSSPRPHVQRLPG
jgi:MOSC domain-containing protein YiiM